MSDAAHAIRDATLIWAERFVVGLNLCPFAAAPLKRGQVRIAVDASDALEPALEALGLEAHRLAEAEPEALETTLLVLPNAPEDFADFIPWLDWAETLLDHVRLADLLRLAHFHPAYRFAEDEGGPDPDAATDAFAGRAPYPTIHLLRADSLDAAAALPLTTEIPARNTAALREIGTDALAERMARFRS